MLSSSTPSSNAPVRVPASPDIKPALWKIADEDTTIYLFGTIHVLPKDFAWRTSTFDAALAQSSQLVLEVADLDDEQAAAQQFLRLAITPDLPDVTKRVPADRRARLKLMLDKVGMSMAAISQFESWAVALTLASAAMNDLRVSAEHGVERELMRNFRDAKKPVIGLETSAEQLGFFDRLPESAQRVFLISLIDEQSDVQTMFDEMIKAWSTGDEQKIALTFDDELALSPELTDALLRQRNRNWTKWIAGRLEKPGTIMVAVGAGHLAGKDSVQAMLRERGLSANRIQ